MYVIRNLTNKPIILSDIRAEIGPYKILDLESAVSRDNIERSSDLKHALATRRLQFVKQTIIRVPTLPTDPPKVIEKTVEIHKPAFDENKLKDIIRHVVKEQMEASNAAAGLEETVHKAMSSGMNTVMDTLRDKLNSINVQIPRNPVEIDIDPSKIAEIQQKAVEKISQDIDTNSIRRGKKIKLIDNNISDRASEL